MNYRVVLNIIGKCMLIVACLMLAPVLVGLIYEENVFSSFFIPIAILLAIGFPLSKIKAKEGNIYTKEGLVSVALVWIIMSLFGALPFIIDGVIPNYIDALFETVSGFTTTGATILTDVEILNKSLAFWRIFTHYIGGMGVIVFILAILPNDKGAMHIFRAESPGPIASKLVSKMSHTARILYLIYLSLTVLEIILLSFSGIGLYDAVVCSLSTAGTGGFSIYNDSIAHYGNVYVEMVVAVFMMLFGINFNVYYLILIGSVSKALLSEELRAYIIIVVVSTLLIAVNILSLCDNFGQAVRYSFFQVNSVSSTTGFMTKDFDAWPSFSKVIIAFLIMTGACGGSTGGGLKVSRLSILVKSTFSDIKRAFNSRAVVTTKFEGKPLTKDNENSIKAYFIIWGTILVLSTLLLSIDSFASSDLLTNFSASLTCLGNVGPGFNLVGPTMNFAGYSFFSKILLSLVMLIGRLEIFPILILFSVRTWKKAG